MKGRQRRAARNKTDISTHLMNAETGIQVNCVHCSAFDYCGWHLTIEWHCHKGRMQPNCIFIRLQSHAVKRWQHAHCDIVAFLQHQRNHPVLGKNLSFSGDLNESCFFSGYLPFDVRICLLRLSGILLAIWVAVDSIANTLSPSNTFKIQIGPSSIKDIKWFHVAQTLYRPFILRLDIWCTTKLRSKLSI